MTRDMILVPREYDGEMCDYNCPLNGFDSDEEAFCYRDGTRLDRDEYGHCLRTAACHATPPARVLTPEMLEAVNEALEKLTTYDEDGMFYSINEMLQAAAKLRAAFGIEEA